MVSLDVAVLEAVHLLHRPSWLRCFLIFFSTFRKSRHSTPNWTTTTSCHTPPIRLSLYNVAINTSYTQCLLTSSVRQTQLHNSTYLPAARLANALATLFVCQQLFTAHTVQLEPRPRITADLQWSLLDLISAQSYWRILCCLVKMQGLGKWRVALWDPWSMQHRTARTGALVVAKILLK